tara:strand:- start:9309 stop:9635 length:327 start_codon:yes stop_codon:yes gene_type:complete
MSDKKNKKWTMETAMAVAKKYSHKSDFNKGDQAAYQWLYRQGKLNEACEHMVRKRTKKGSKMAAKVDCPVVNSVQTVQAAQSAPVSTESTEVVETPTSDSSAPVAANS